MAALKYKKYRFWVLLLITLCYTNLSAQGIWYVTGSSQPWNQQANVNAMNAVLEWPTGVLVVFKT
ncbi:MAG: hypothetical protein EBQ77_01265 [Sphingobacteriia bacterium]|nr:hypothetical protein [Sphingobacteriia bacterium]